MSSVVRISADADGSFDLTVWLPEAAPACLLLIQEIFGVSDYIRAVATTWPASATWSPRRTCLAVKPATMPATTRVPQESFGVASSSTPRKALPMLPSRCST